MNEYIYVVVHNNGWEENVIGFCKTESLAKEFIRRMPPLDLTGAGMPGMETPRYFIRQEVLHGSLDDMPDMSEPGSVATFRWIYEG